MSINCRLHCDSNIDSEIYSMLHDQAKTRIKQIFQCGRFQDGRAKSRINTAVLSEARQLVVEFDGRLPGRTSNGGLIMRLRKTRPDEISTNGNGEKVHYKG